jgi:hypothetical protein
LAAILQGDPATAGHAFHEALNLARQTAHPHSVANAIFGHALAATLSREGHRAAMLHGASSKMFDDMGEALEPLEARMRDSDYRQLAESLGSDEFDLGLNRGRTMSAQSITELAETATAQAQAAV